MASECIARVVQGPWPDEMIREVNSQGEQGVVKNQGGHGPNSLEAE